jgi:hypothetical protein
MPPFKGYLPLPRVPLQNQVQGFFDFPAFFFEGLA